MTAIDLFCGGGGSALGAAKAGFDNILAVDVDPYKIRLLKKNQKLFEKFGCNLVTREANLLKIEPSELGSEADLIIGGVPCQPFSHSGKRKGFGDPRNGLTKFFSYIEYFAPNAFLLENVPGLLHGKFTVELASCIGDAFSACRADVIEWLEAVGKGPQTLNVDGYSLNASVVNSANHGLAQNRKRLFIFGLSKAERCDWSWPVHTHSLERLLFSMFRTEEYLQLHDLRSVFIPKRFTSGKYLNGSFTDVPAQRRWKTVRDVCQKLGTPRDCAEGDDYGHNIREGARSYAGHIGSYPDMPAKTIKAGVNGVLGGENMIRWKNGRLRYFTLRECASLQGFPTGYRFTGNFQQVLNAIGNAVPPIVVERIVSSFVAEKCSKKFRRK